MKTQRTHCCHTKEKRNPLRPGQGVEKATQQQPHSKRPKIPPEQEHIQYIFNRNISGDFVGNETDAPDAVLHQEALETPMPSAWSLQYQDGFAVRWYIITAASGKIAKFRLHFDGCECAELLEAYRRTHTDPEMQGDGTCSDDDEEEDYDIAANVGSNRSGPIEMRGRLRENMMVDLAPLTDDADLQAAQQEFQWLRAFLTAHISPRWKSYSQYPVDGFRHFAVGFYRRI